MSFELILPFIRPLEPFLADPDVSEIMVTVHVRCTSSDAANWKTCPTSG